MMLKPHLGQNQYFGKILNLGQIADLNLRKMIFEPKFKSSKGYPQLILLPKSVISRNRGAFSGQK